MNFWIRVFTALFLISVLCGCLDLETTVRVKPDGSGMLESKVLVNPQVGSLMTKSAEGNENRSPDLLDEEKLKRDAAKMGSGVRFVSAERITSKEGSGYRALYAFDDINTLKIRPNLDEPSQTGTGSGKKPLPEKITFSFKKGTPSILTIRLPKPQEKEQSPKKEAPPEKPVPGQEEKQDASKNSVEMLKSIFQGLRMVFAVELQGSVVNTNATYREGSRITLMEFDFDQLTSNMEQFQKLANADPQTPSEIAEVMRSFPGVKSEMQETVTVEFR